jgi:hypothetical protein
MRKSIKKNSKNSKKLLKSPTTTINNSTLKKCEDFCKNDYVVEMAKEYKKIPDEAKIGTKKGGKWSLKYKRSINCRRPKGFSQKQYCKYRNRR